MKSLITVDQFRDEARSKRNSGRPVFRVNPGAPEDAGYRTKRFCFSDGSVDRMGDTIDPAGWDLEAFERNPVALWAHDGSQPPIGRATNVGRVGARLMGDITFADAETYAFADTIYRLVDGKFINAVSVGFMPLEYVFVDNDSDRPWGIDFTKQQLLEISVCPIPANPNALGAARAKGIDTRPLSRWAERALDLGDCLSVTRRQLARLRSDASEPARTRVAGSRAADLATAAAIRSRLGPARPAQLSRAETMSRDLDLEIAALHAARLARSRTARLDELGTRALALYRRGLL